MPVADLSRKIEKLRGLCLAAAVRVRRRSSIELEISIDPSGTFIVASCSEEDKSFPIVFSIKPPGGIQADWEITGPSSVCNLSDVGPERHIAYAIENAIKRKFG
jgi:hypothetical protein